jgi:hypothetical protein
MSGMPKLSAVAKYWSERNTFRNLEWTQPGCFACGYWSQARFSTVESGWQASRLERCHLVSASEGGTTDLSNIVLLCGRCHRKAPAFGVRQPMIDWINRQENYISWMMRRIEEELRAIDPNLPEDGAALNLGREEFHRMMNLAARGMQLAYHPEGEIFASVAAMVSNVVQSFKASNACK